MQDAAPTTLFLSRLAGTLARSQNRAETLMVVATSGEARRLNRLVILLDLACAASQDCADDEKEMLAMANN